MFQIIITDSSRPLRRHLEQLLSKAGYQCYPAASARETLCLLEEISADLILMDISLPDMNGYEFIKLLRNYSSELPILVLSENCLLSDMKRSFLAGADDFMGKPAAEEELVLRIHALLRRFHKISKPCIRVGSTWLDSKTLTVGRESQVQTLPRKEFQLLYKLLSCPEQIFTRGQLLEEIWGPATNSMEPTDSVHINRLRKRFAQSPDFHILTVRGLGYKASLRV